jgi:sulfate transport system substrate-binding protein
VLARYRAQFRDIRLVSIDEAFGGWDAVTKVHFAEGGVIDQLLAGK